MKNKKQRHFLKLYEPVHDSFERFCRARAYGDYPFEDLINESLLVAYSKMDQLQKAKSFLSFLIGISIRLLANSKKKAKPEYTSDEDFLQNMANPVNELDQKFEVDLLYNALSQLGAEQRECLILFEITGFSIKEIMAIQDSSESAIKQRLARGRKELGIIISKEMNYIKTKV